VLKTQVWCGEDDLGEWGKEIDWAGRHKREVASGSTQKFRDVDRRFMRRRRPELAENGVGSPQR
jgi:hypothetical protein